MSLGTVCGVGLAAGLVGGGSVVTGIADLGSSLVGTGVFLAGFLLYVAVWE